MADSIAKLAVIITGDANPLARTTEQASEAVKKFDRNVRGSTGSLVNMGTAMSAARGNAVGLFKVFESGNLATGFTAAAAAVGLFVMNLARAADVMREDYKKAVDEARAAQDELFGGRPKTIAEAMARPPIPDAGSAVTWSSEWERVQRAFEAIGTKLPVFQALTGAIADNLEDWATWLGVSPHSIRDQEIALRRLAAEQKAEAAIIKERRRQIEGLAREINRVDEAARDAGARGLKQLADSANQMVSSLRTPLEILNDNLNQLAEFRTLGAIGEGTLASSVERLLQKYMDAVRKPTRTVGGIPATERFTSAGFSAMEAGKREMARLERAGQEQVNRLTMIHATLNRILDAIKNQEPIVFAEGDLN